MNYRNYFFASAVAIVLCACGNDTEQTQEVEQVPQAMKLTSSLTSSTRGPLDTDNAITRLQASQIAANENVYAWVEDRSGSTVTSYINAWVLTADGSGNFSGDTKYYPATGHNVDIYCVHGNFAATPSGAFGTALTHTVELDQSVTDATSGLPTAYLKSDLLYGSVQDKGRVASQSIVFKHKLAKIEVKLQKGNGVTAAQLAHASTTVHILNTNNVASYTPAKDAAYAELAPAKTITSYGGTVNATGYSGTTGTNNTTGITMYLQKDNTEASTVNVFGEAIIVPQQISSADNFIKVHLGDGGELYAKLSANKTFEAGKKYVYTITVNLTELQLTSTITDWESENAGNFSPTL